MSTWPNGELKTTERIQDESWYSDYQMLMEMALFETNTEALLKNFVDDYQSIHNRLLSEDEIKRYRKWAEYHAQLSLEFQKQQLEQSEWGN